MVVPVQPGGSNDFLARVLGEEISGQWLSERLGQQFIIENRPGAT
jgi:tripartite-type tricarboxylate transporter receptor subunit TctC